MRPPKPFLFRASARSFLIRACAGVQLAGALPAARGIAGENLETQFVADRLSPEERIRRTDAWRASPATADSRMGSATALALFAALPTSLPAQKPHFEEPQRLQKQIANLTPTPPPVRSAPRDPTEMRILELSAINRAIVDQAAGISPEAQIAAADARRPEIDRRNQEIAPLHSVLQKSAAPSKTPDSSTHEIPFARPSFCLRDCRPRLARPKYHRDLA